jgi:hypothetical protein
MPWGEANMINAWALLTAAMNAASGVKEVATGALIPNFWITENMEVYVSSVPAGIPVDLEVTSRSYPHEHMGGFKFYPHKWGFIQPEIEDGTIVGLRIGMHRGMKLHGLKLQFESIDLQPDGKEKLVTTNRGTWKRSDAYSGSLEPTAEKMVEVTVFMEGGTLLFKALGLYWYLPKA